MPFRSTASGSLVASFVCLATLGGCQESDVEKLDEAFNRNGDYAGAPYDAHGRFETRIWDMLDGSSKVTHHLMDHEARVDTEVILEDGLTIERDAIIDAWGEYDENGALVVNSLEVVERPPQPLIDAEERLPRRIATILVQWNGGGLANAEGRQLMYTGDQSTNVFYAENSYGIETMSGDVFGPYTIADPGGCNAGQIQFFGEDALVEHGHNPDKWDQFMFHFPGIGGCGWAGLASVGSPDQPAAASWYNGSFGCVTRNQELGHNYGMGHSHRHDCTDDTGLVPFSDNCSHEEYGHRYDPMGGGCGHINMVQKQYMGWVDDCNIVTATDDGTFNISPIQLPCDGPQAVRFQAFDGRYYWLEYRIGDLGHFSNIDDGIIVHVAAETGGSPSPYLLDMGVGDFLFEGDSYTDPEGVVTFEAVEFQDSHAVVSVTFADPSGNDPTCADGSVPEMEGGNWGELVCSAEPYDGDMEPPEITLTFPEDEAWYEPGSDFTILADVSDDRVIIDVELYLDGEKLFRITEPPWEWDVTNIPEGDYNFGAIARDSRYATPSNAIDVHIGEIPEDETTGDPATTGDSDSAETGEPMGTGEPEDDGEDETGTTAAETNANDGGCNCRSSGSGAPGFALLFLGLAWARRRRSA